MKAVLFKATVLWVGKQKEISVNIFHPSNEILSQQ